MIKQTRDDYSLLGSTGMVQTANKVQDQESQDEGTSNYTTHGYLEPQQQNPQQQHPEPNIPKPPTTNIVNLNIPQAIQNQSFIMNQNTGTVGTTNESTTRSKTTSIIDL